MPRIETSNRSLTMPKCGALSAVTKGGSIVDHRPSFSSLSARYDEFLFAPVCDEANGMRLSVISALARMNVDPWDEAARLAAMPKAIAEKKLASILNLASGSSSKSPEAEVIAARLIRLLPKPGESPRTLTAGGAASAAQWTSYWWVWVCFALTMSFLMPHHTATTANQGTVTSDSGAPASVKPAAISPPNSGVPVPDAVGLSR